MSKEINTNTLEQNQKKDAYDMLYLAVCGVTGKKPDEKRISSMDFSAVYNWSLRHSISAIVYSVLEPFLPEGKLKEQWFRRKDFVEIVNATMDSERLEVLNFCEENRIWYMPLKGVVLKDWYPKNCTREMGDNDILIDEDGRKALHDFFVNRGYTVNSYKKAVEDKYIKKPFLFFEIHGCLFDYKQNALWHNYYRDLKGRFLRDENNQFGFHLSNEDLYVYIIVHAAKHAAAAGTGTRSLLDFFVLMRKFGDALDREYINTQLKLLRVDKFEAKCRAIYEEYSDVSKIPSGNGDESSPVDMFVLSATFGIRENRISNAIHGEMQYKKKSLFSARLAYIKRRVFLRRDLLCTLYPALKKHKILLPFCHIHRWLSSGFRGRKRIFGEIKTIMSVKKED